MEIPWVLQFVLFNILLESKKIGSSNIENQTAIAKMQNQKAFSFSGHSRQTKKSTLVANRN